MKRPTFFITVPKPCHEKWESMDATERGAFCHSCSKEVIDFSIMTDREVIEYLQKHKAGCGRFRKDQLDTKLTIPQVDNGIFRWKALLLGALPILSGKDMMASRYYHSDQARADQTKIDTIAVHTETHLNPDPVVSKFIDNIERGEIANRDSPVVLPQVEVIAVVRPEVDHLIAGMMVKVEKMEVKAPEESHRRRYMHIDYPTPKQERKNWFRRFFHLD